MDSMTVVAAAHISEHVLAMVFQVCGYLLWSEASDACRKGMALRRLAQRLREGAPWRMCSQSSRTSRGTLLLRKQATRLQRPGPLSLQMRQQQL